jgi:beta-galactosidase
MTRCSLLALVILPFDLAEIALPASPVAPLPPGVKIVWDLDSAYREATPTRERVSLNGLWRWQPAETPSAPLPEERWGYFKVPGCWPGISDYMQKDCQTVIAHDSWKNVPLGRISAAWYQREFELPAAWADRRITLAAEYVNSLAAVFVNGKKAGEIRYPGGECNLTSACHVGRKHVLGLLVEALPLEGVMLSFANTAQARQVKGSVARRGLCGDVFLVATPQTARIADIKVDTSVRRGEITFDAALQNLAPQRQFSLRARIKENGRQIAEFSGKAMTAADLREGRVAFTAKWKPDRLWDLHTPKNMVDLELSLLDAAGNVLDAGFPVRFGFREFWIDGRDFYLNGTRVFLSAVPLDNAQVGALQTAPGVRHQLRLHAQLRLRAGLAPELRGDPSRG